jgi:hypothetical protein
MAKDHISDHASAIDYIEFVRNVDEFQRNIQDSVVWSLFRSFDGR